MISHLHIGDETGSLVDFVHGLLDLVALNIDFLIWNDLLAGGGAESVDFPECIRSEDEVIV